MYHFFSEHEHIHDTYIDIVGSDVNHIKNVLRLKTGDSLLISSGDNIDYTCHIAQIDEEHIRADIDSVDERGRELASKIYLFQGLPKADKMELVIQKAVELGAFEVIPVAIAESAAKQSKRSILPQVSDVVTFAQAVKMAENCQIKLLPYECADGMEKTKRLIENITPGQDIAVFIGPEGGFDLDELELAKEAGCEIITLGKRILRTETAGMMLLSVLMYHLEQ